jgi:hypothetical protein
LNGKNNLYYILRYKSKNDSLDIKKENNEDSDNEMDKK